MLRLMQLERQIQTLEQASRQDKDKIERLELQQNEALEHENLVRELTSEVENHSEIETVLESSVTWQKGCCKPKQI